MNTTNTGSDYTRQSAPINSRAFSRWLVVVDIMPDVGAVTGFQQIKLGRRTLNVVGKRDLSEALELIRNSNRTMRFLARDNNWQSSFRYGFSLVDLATQSCVTTEQVQSWANPNEYNSLRAQAAGVSDSQRERDYTRAAAIALNLSGKAAPSPVLLDAQDPIQIMKNRALLPMMDVSLLDGPPQNIGDALRQAVTPDEYNAATSKAAKESNNVWAVGLISLPGLIEESLDRVIDRKVSTLTNRLLVQGVADTSPRLMIIRPTIERLLAQKRNLVAGKIYRAIVLDYINYTMGETLDIVTAAVFDDLISPFLPSYLQPGNSLNNAAAA